MSLNPHERETTITLSDGDDLVHIYTAQRTVITQLRKRPAFTEIDAGEFEGSIWAEFTIPADQWSPATGVKRTRTLTDEQRATLTERLRSVRARAA
jgi:hypothetical protein